MSPRFLFPLAAVSLNLWAPSVFAQLPETPKASAPGTSVELVAMEPDIRTPTSIATDARGRLWVLENNTHFRPKNYQGPPTDRIVIMEDFGPDGRARKFTTFAADFRDGMALRLLGDGDVLLSTRMETWRLRDTNGDGVCDSRTRLLKLDTADLYPHNGLSSIAVDSQGLLYIGLGENHGMAWTLTGTDGSTVKGADEGGILRCDLEGRHLSRWAKGFWNPFGMGFDSAGRLFVLDNDPGAGSLCRLLHIVQGGDYGFRYRYGRTANHPFLSWMGQLPGTLPPVCLSGEAPVGMLARGDELVGCSWNDHVVQRFPLSPRGASWKSEAQVLVSGNSFFRPSGIAAGPNGNLYVADWADGAYEVHGKGRVWRIKEAAGAVSGRTPALTVAEKEAAALLSGTAPVAGAIAALKSEDPYLVHAGIEALAHQSDASVLRNFRHDSDAKVRLGILLALRRRGEAEARAELPDWLKDGSVAVKIAALQWISEEGLKELQPLLETALGEPLARSTFEAYVATLEFLKTGKPDASAATREMVAMALDPARQPALRAMALRLVPPANAALNIESLRSVLASAPASAPGESLLPLKLEAVRILAARSDAGSQDTLRALAGETSLPLKLEALAGLALSLENPATQQTLRSALGDGQPAIVGEALRTLRGKLNEADAAAALPKAAASPALAEQLAFAARTSPVAGLAQSVAQKLPALKAIDDAALLATPGDAAAGRRLFYHPSGPRCFTCHSVEGRGAAVGPDLSEIGRLSAAELLEAIREPSKAIAPAYTTFRLTLKDGAEVYGIDQFQDNKSATTICDATGKTTQIKNEQIVRREPLAISLMPPGLAAMMTSEEMRDLIAFLHSTLK